MVFNMEKVKSVLERLIENLGLSVAFQEQRAIDVWDEVVGNEIRMNTSPQKVKNGILYVSVNSPIWAQELQFVKRQIIEKINQTLKANLIRDIVFRVALISCPKPSVKREKKKATLPWMKQEAERIASIIKDPILRKYIMNAYVSYLKKKEDIKNQK